VVDELNENGIGLDLFDSKEHIELLGFGEFGGGSSSGVSHKLPLSAFVKAVKKFVLWFCNLS
jgi:hypothetical protein